LYICIKEKNTFKYQNEFEKLIITCPPSDYIALNRVAFRSVFDDLKDDNNFKPVYFKNPKRFNDKLEDEICLSMGLSFFETLDKAERRFIKLRKRLGEEAFKILGTQIAEGTITEDEGVSNVADLNGHFTHHPTIEFKYSNKLSIVKSLK
jgi:hypothetical protein